ncbi:hypothetical protein ANASTE_01033 [Anaerofustis stercorihominis DSM 17244]|uniref:Uncharacterized protein n=1 Tax=Anaerofustis stercorihominis DSM 17244 TaxID=445971 RepID=B1C8H6_9FIRM|nr:hypothetical protein ANASTE_01033 [Anaerofustis stercorihominis DSM 17244]
MYKKFYIILNVINLLGNMRMNDLGKFNIPPTKAKEPRPAGSFCPFCD